MENIISTIIAMTTTGIAPANNLEILKLERPSKTNFPKPPAPMIAVRIAILLASIEANFSPANNAG